MFAQELFLPQQPQDTRVYLYKETRHEFDGDEYDNRSKIDPAEGRGDVPPYRFIEREGDCLYESRSKMYPNEGSPGKYDIDENHPLDQSEENKQRKKEEGHQ